MAELLVARGIGVPVVVTTIVNSSTFDSIGAGVARIELGDLVVNDCAGGTTKPRDIPEFDGTVELNPLKDDNNGSVGGKTLVFGATGELGTSIEAGAEVDAEGVGPDTDNTMIGDATLVDTPCIETSIVGVDVALDTSLGNCAIAVKPAVDLVTVNTMSGAIVLVLCDELNPNVIATDVETVEVEKAAGNSLVFEESMPDNGNKPNVSIADAVMMDAVGNSCNKPVTLKIVLDGRSKAKV